MSYKDQRSPVEIAQDRKVLHRVMEGIKFLKEKFGDNWVDEIDLDTLSLQSGAHCVLGQLYPDPIYENEGANYSSMLDRLGLEEDEAEGLGFDSETGFTYEYNSLTRVWKQEIETLRASR